MEQPAIPVKGVICKSASISVSASRQTIFNYISNGSVLSQWLKKCGPVNGAAKTVLNEKSYDSIGASRTVFFDNGCTIKETLTWFDPHSYYSYCITDNTNFLKYFTAIEYGQWWFEEVNGVTDVRWTSTFVSTNVLTKLVLSVFLHLFYTRFMKQALQQAKAQIEKSSI